MVICGFTAIFGILFINITHSARNIGTELTQLARQTATKNTGISTETATKNTGISTETATKTTGISTETATKNNGISTETATKNTDISTETATKTTGISTETATKNTGISTGTATKTTGITTGTAIKTTGISTETATKNTGISTEIATQTTGNISTENKEFELYDKDVVFTVARYLNLELNRHVSKLISKFHCSIQPIKLLIIVTSQVSNFNRRQTIRNTWGKMLHKQVNNDFKTFFAVGISTDKEIMTKVKQEAELNKDIIFGDFNDTFYNLPFKVEAGFEWAYKHCSCDFYLKSDDDVFINLPKVFSLLRKETKSKKLYLGNRHSIE